MQWFSGLSGIEQAFLATLFTYAMTVAGAALIFCSGKLPKQVVTAMSGGAAGIMIAASFFSLLLPAMEYEAPMPVFWVVTAGFLLGGGFLVCGDILLKNLGRGRNEKGRKCMLLYAAVTLHNLPEGMAVGVAFASVLAGEGLVSAIMLAIGIGIQNFPEGTCLAYPLKELGFSNKKSFFLSQSSAWVEVLGGLLGAFTSGMVGGSMPWVLSFSAGAMIAVVCSELIPECFEENKTTATLGVVLGFALMMFLDLAFG